MEVNPEGPTIDWGRAGVGLFLIGLGVVLLASSRGKWAAPCVDCDEESPEQTAADVAAASAAVVAEAEEVVGADD